MGVMEVSSVVSLSLILHTYLTRICISISPNLLPTMANFGHDVNYLQYHYICKVT